MVDNYIEINTHGAPVTLESGAYSLVARIDGKTEVIGHFSILRGFPHDILVKVAPVQSNYTVYAGPDGDIADGQITIYESSGNYSQSAAAALLGADGAAVAASTVTFSSQLTGAVRVGDQFQSPANSRTMR